MKKIYISGGKGRGLFVLVDDEDYKVCSSHRWHINGKYASANIKETPNDPPKSIRMHRFITKCPKGKMVDHIDGNTLNNQKENLRICNDSENGMNKKKKSNTSSMYKGVMKNGNYNTYYSEIVVRGIKIKLGFYRSQEEAAEAYNEAAITHFGEFAKLNDIIYPEGFKRFGRRSKGSSIYTGVSMVKRTTPSKTYRYWTSIITVNRKIMVKRFPYTAEGEIMAALDYNQKSTRFFGDKAKLNKV